MTDNSTTETGADRPDPQESRIGGTTRRAFMTTLAAGSVTASTVRGRSSGVAPTSSSEALSNHVYGAGGYGAGPYGGGGQPDRPPVLPGQDARPTDPDNDGLYEDLEGDGDFDIFDVRTLFLLMDNQVVEENRRFFNFDDRDDEIDIFDVRALFNELVDGD